MLSLISNVLGPLKVWACQIYADFLMQTVGLHKMRSGLTIGTGTSTFIWEFYGSALQVTDEIRSMSMSDLKHQELPLARIKKIMKLDDDVKVCNVFLS